MQVTNRYRAHANSKPISNMQLAFPKKVRHLRVLSANKGAVLGWWSGNKSNKAISLEQHQGGELKFLWKDTSKLHTDLHANWFCTIRISVRLADLRLKIKSAQGRCPFLALRKKKLSNLMDKSVLSDRNHMKSGKINYKHTACITSWGPLPKSRP